jgi:hypothetical protein
VLAVQSETLASLAEKHTTRHELKLQVTGIIVTEQEKKERAIEHGITASAQ